MVSKYFVRIIKFVYKLLSAKVVKMSLFCLPIVLVGTGAMLAANGRVFTKAGNSLSVQPGTNAHLKYVVEVKN
jgi:hypothetical protein